MTRCVFRLWRPTAFAIALAAAGCAPRTAPPPSAAPRFPDLVFPAVPAGLGDAVVNELHHAAWRALQAGDLRGAERDFTAAVRRAPGFYPAEAGLGYVELARQRDAQALAHFDAALQIAREYAPALAGRGDALLAADRLSDALASFEAALTADAGLTEVRRRIEVLRFRALEAEVGAARRAHDAQQYDQARQAYERAIRTSPDSALLHRELALVERELGRLDSALAHARRAVELDAGDARAYATLGEIHTSRGEFAEALAAFERADAIEPTEALKDRMAEVRERGAAARRPAQYRAIVRATELTRGELAALVAVRLDSLLKQARRNDAAFITDTRGHWASAHILAVARAGVMEVYPNYTFQPSAAVRRGELASVVSRLLSILASARSPLAERWRNPQYAFSDLAPGHLSYAAAALAVTSGVLPALAGNTFQLSRIVTGAEAVAAVERIEKLIGSRP